MPPAAEKLAAELKTAARSVSQLEAAEGDAERASLIVGLRDVADYAARVLVACYGADPRDTLQKAHCLRAAAGHVLNDAEILADRSTAGSATPLDPHGASQIHAEPQSPGPRG
jgi:hypothetical protein